MINDIQTLRVLEPYFHGHSGVSEIFMTVWGNGKRANSPQEEAVLSVLVGAGASGEAMDMALLETVKTVSTTPAGFAFIVNLLNAGADVNYCEGACLVEAATQANVHIIKELLAYGPRRSNMTRAFPLVFRSGADAQSLREIAVAFCSHSSAPDLTYDHPTCGPVLCLMLHTYPNEAELLQYLIDKGSVVDPVVKATLPLSPSEEKVSLLCWALAQSKAALREDVVEILIKSGGRLPAQFYPYYTNYSSGRQLPSSFIPKHTPPARHCRLTRSIRRCPPTIPRRPVTRIKQDLTSIPRCINRRH